MKDFIKKHQKLLIMLGVLLFFLILGYIFPYSGDDWYWGSSVGYARFKTFFHDYNGRYAANIISLVVNRSLVLRTFYVGILLFLIPYLSYKLINEKRFSLFLLATFLLLAVNKSMFRQVIAWTSGFVNYTTPVVLLLVYFHFLKSTKENKMIYLLMFFLGFGLTLFVEHITIYSIVINISILIFAYLKSKKISFKSLFHLAGSVAGAICMFTNGNYLMVLENKSGYQKISHSFIDIIRRAHANMTTIYKEAVMNNIWLNIILGVLLLAIIIKVLYKKKEKNSKKKIMGYSAMVIIIGFLMYSLLAYLNPNWRILLNYTPYFEFLITVLFYFSILLVVLLFIDNADLKRNIFFYWFSIGVLIGQLFFVSPIGSRCFFICYVLFILIILELYNYCYKKDLLFVNHLCGLGIIIFMVYLASIYLYTYKVDQERIRDLIKEVEKGNKDINFENLPYDEYVWDGNVYDYTTYDKLKHYYHIPDDVIINGFSNKGVKR